MTTQSSGGHRAATAGYVLISERKKVISPKVRLPNQLDADTAV
jgi:hypothetical protein